MLVRPTSDFRLDRWGLEIVCNLVATVACGFDFAEYIRASRLALVSPRLASPRRVALLPVLVSLEETCINSY